MRLLSFILAHIAIASLSASALGQSSRQQDTSVPSAAPSPSISVVFSPAKLQESHLELLRQWLDQAQSSIDIAMYSMSRSGDVIDAIRAARKRNVQVRFLFDDAGADQRNPVGSLSSQLEDMGVDVRYINKIMHHKFALIDARGSDRVGSAALISGSANWTGSAATFYDENTIFVRNEPGLIQQYRQEFDHLWRHSRDFVWGNILSDLNADPITVENDDAGRARAYFTSANFSVMTNSYGYGFTVIDGLNSVSDVIVDQIRLARRSIRIASGHFRSHAIAMALLEAKRQYPQLLIQVYLDNQEYISYSTQLAQKKKREMCLAAAESIAEHSACYDRGYYYSYEAKAAGIDLRFKSYAYRWHYSYAPQMHHKYVIIDDQILVTGSYNFSDNAEHETMENIVVMTRAQYAEVVENFVQNFSRMWDLNRGALQPLTRTIETADTIPLVFPAMALNWSELTSLKRSLSANCKIINSNDYRRHPERHTTCPRTM